MRTAWTEEHIAIITAAWAAGKAASEVYAPAAGEGVEANGARADAPATVNSAPEGAGWLYKIKLANPADLNDAMDKAAYDAYVGGLH